MVAFCARLYRRMFCSGFVSSPTFWLETPCGYPLARFYIALGAASCFSNSGEFLVWILFAYSGQLSIGLSLVDTAKQSICTT